ncbi:MAG: hypothetical protein FJZ96_07185 [Chloroflexi bacterium]|nr:hypothetical protein [Chloroflexota bacterium]
MKSALVYLNVLLIFALASCSLPGTPAEDSPALSDDAACLQGVWEMSNADLNAMLSILIPVPGMRIPVGTFYMTFSGTQFAYQSDGYTLRIDLADGYMEADALFLTSGTFSAQAGNLTFSDLIYDQEISTWRAVINGVTADVPGTTTISIPPPGSGPYVCSGSTLTIESMNSAGAPFDMVFSRLP